MQWWGREKRILSFLIAEIVHVRAQQQLTHPAFYHTSGSPQCQETPNARESTKGTIS